jgi:hypothetical protein
MWAEISSLLDRFKAGIPKKRMASEFSKKGAQGMMSSSIKNWVRILLEINPSE